MPSGENARKLWEKGSFAVAASESAAANAQEGRFGGNVPSAGLHGGTGQRRRVGPPGRSECPGRTPHRNDSPEYLPANLERASRG
jgi:hypothetical protein